MNSISYRIELEPLGDFFFGGETTFGEDNERNYFAKSGKFPQQSALVGMLRFELLKAKKLLPISHDKKGEVKLLIGEKSFDFERNNNESGFGIIETISPVFLTDNNQDFIAAPFDYVYKDSINWRSGNRVYLSGNIKNRQIDFASFDVKNHNYETQYLGTKDRKRYSESDFFETNVKVGVNTLKSRESGDDKEAFFKQEFVNTKDKRRFAFYTQLKEDVSENNTDLLVSLGGEQSMFRMNIKKAENTYERDCKLLFEAKEKIILISDACVSSQQKEVLDKSADFAWSDTVVFRNIKTSIDENNYANKPKKSSKIHLLKRGSVFYYSSEDAKKEIIQSLKNDNLQRCGFNLYID